ncbi:MAG: phosphoglucomutase/phosphomannomutase family protein [Rhodothermales bacterium]
MTNITFGTDGWRGIIADDFTFRNLDTVSRATLRWLRRQHGDAPRAVVGYDTRFMGRQFAEYVARVLASQEVTVMLADAFTPTQAVSWATKAYEANVGVVITASHNPPEYNGFKLKADFGGSAPPEMVSAVQGELPRLGGDAVAPPGLERMQAEGRIERRPVTDDFLDYLRGRLDLEAIRSSGLLVVHDAMYGSGQGLLSRLIGEDRVEEIRSTWNPGFDGEAPEPIERNLAGLARAVIDRGAAAGLANDGDADRVGMYDERGRFVDSHTIVALLVKYLHTEQHLSGLVVKTVSTTSLIDRMAAAYGLPLETTPIGFKYIASRIVEEDVLVGGEESGGIAVKGHIPERDGLYIGLLILEMMAKRRRKLSELVEELHDEFGPHVCRRIDLHTTEARKQNVLKRLREEGGLAEIAGEPVHELDTLDGFKHLVDGGWLLVRPSGTEPVLRIYSEAASGDRADALIRDAAEQLGVADESA